MTEQKEIIDLEEYTKSGKPVPEDKRYQIRIDREKFIIDVECMTGKELLKLANKVPIEKWQLNQILRGGQVKKVGYDESVCFTAPGIERFVTLPKDPTEG